MRSCGSVALALCLGVIAVATARTQAQANVQAIYKDALSREAAIRKDLDAARPEAPPAALLTRLRTLVGAYEDLARLFPTSDTSDDSLWHGGMLSAEAFWKFGDERDRNAALRLLEVLRVRYPVSTLTKQLPPHLARLTQTGAARAAAPTASAAAPAAKPIAPTAGAAAPTAGAAAPAAGGAGPPAKPVTPPGTPAPPASTGAPPATPAPPTSATPAAAGTATLRAIHREALREVLRVTLELDVEVPFHHERIEGPPRVFIDLQGTRTVDDLRDATLPFADDVVRQIRVGRHAASRTRVVLDLHEAGRYSVYSLYNPYRLVFDFERAGRTAVTTSRPDPAVRPVPAAPAAGVPPPAAPPDAPAPAASASAPASGSRPSPPAANGSGGFSLSRQLGLGISRIVIDPGHGGRDPGAKARDLSEAELVLDIAQRLEKLLVKQGVEVVLTRTKNSYMTLEERTALANSAGADLFLSIHANASSIASARGVETYYLNFAQSSAAEALAARENANSTQAMRNLPDIVKAIALNNKIDESRDFATSVQDALHERLRRVDRNVKNLGVKQAPFMVLIGATMPSVLVEIAFLTHRQEAALLKTDRYRQQVAEALQAGITRYQQSVKRTPVVAAH
jgi:N-acetylmuramoyl-L-alanine amidase